jgi:hypothetical protein
MKRFLVTLLGFGFCPGLLAIVVFSRVSGPQLIAGHANLNPFAVLLLILVGTGTALSLVFQRRLFSGSAVALLLGLVAGLMAGLITYILYGDRVANPRGLFVQIPIFGVICGGFLLVVIQKWRIFIGEIPKPQYVFGRLTADGLPKWKRILVRCGNSIAEGDVRRLFPRYRRLHQAVVSLTIILFLLLLVGGYIAIFYLLGYDIVRSGPVSFEPWGSTLLWCVSVMCAILACFILAWWTVSFLCIALAARWRFTSLSECSGYIKMMKYPAEWIRDECK